MCKLTFLGSARLFAVFITIIGGNYSTVAALLPTVGSAQKRITTPIAGNVRVQNGNTIFVPNAASATPQDPSTPPSSSLATNINASLKTWNIEGQNIPLTIYETNNKAIGIGPQSTGVLENAIGAPAVPSDFEDLRNNIPATPADFARDLPKLNTTELKRQAAEYESNYVRAIESNASTSVISKALQENRSLQDIVSTATIDLLKGVRSGEQKAVSVRTLETLRDSTESLLAEEKLLENKGTYRETSIYRPDSYSHIFSNAMAVGRIQRSTDKKLAGSCVHIGNGYFLTASHVLRSLDEKKYEVKFPQIQKNFKFKLIKDLWSNGGNTRSDVALCKLNLQTNDTIPGARISKSLASSQTEYLDKDTGLYVIGFPNISDSGQNILSEIGQGVHDDCKIVVPRWVSPKLIAETFFHLTLRDQRQLCADPSEKLAADIDALTKKFKNLYSFDFDAPNPAVEGYEARYNGHAIFGLDSDTSPGNSGGGVFQKKSGELVGIFGGGSLEIISVPSANSAVFEYALPIESFWTNLVSYLTF